MLAYFLMFFLVAIPALGQNKRLNGYNLLAILTIFSIFIGLRHDIGADWSRYVTIASNYGDQTVMNVVIPRGEYLYRIINWLSSKLGGGIYLVNSICAIIFITGLIKYCKATNYPWLALTIAYPVLILVVSLGYTRQATAIGIEFLLLLALEKGLFTKSFILASLGVGFHLSFMSIGLLIINTLKRYALRFQYFFQFIIASGIIGYLGLIAFERASERYISTYIFAEYGNYTSAGAIYRIIPTVIAAILIIIYKRKFIEYGSMHVVRIYSNLAFASIFILTLMIIFQSNTTLFDRFALYCSPLAIFVFTRAVDMKLLNLSRFSSTFLIISTSFLYLAGWLFLGTHAQYWLPYQNILLPFEIM